MILYFISFIITKIFFEWRIKQLVTKKPEIKKILVVNLAHIGDLVLTTPFLSGLRNQFPASEITLLCGEWASPIFKKNKIINKIIIYNSNAYNRTNISKNSFKKIFKLICNLSYNKYDIVFELRTDIWIILLSVFSKIKYRIDHPTNRINRRLSIIFRKSNQVEDIHYCIQYYNVLDFFGAPPSELLLKLEVNANEKQWAENKLKSIGISINDFIVFINPFSEWYGREWDIKNYAAIIKYIIDNSKAIVIITGMQKDNIRADELMKISTKNRIFNITGETTIESLIALYSFGKVFIGSDGGAMHIAAALGLYIIALFGPQAPGIFGPYTKKKIILYHKVECSPCLQKICDRKPSCMELITINEMINAFNYALGECKD